MHPDYDRFLKEFYNYDRNKNQYEYCKNETHYDTDISKYSIEEIVNDFFDNLYRGTGIRRRRPDIPRQKAGCL